VSPLDRVDAEVPPAGLAAGGLVEEPARAVAGAPVGREGVVDGDPALDRNSGASGRAAAATSRNRSRSVCTHRCMPLGSPGPTKQLRSTGSETVAGGGLRTRWRGRSTSRPVSRRRSPLQRPLGVGGREVVDGLDPDLGESLRVGRPDALEFLDADARLVVVVDRDPSSAIPAASAGSAASDGSSAAPPRRPASRSRPPPPCR